jgi:hypothetical protein
MKQRELTTIPADVIELAGGHNLALERRKGEDELKIFCRDGRVSLSVVLTDQGPLLRFAGSALAIQATGELSLEAEQLTLRGRSGLSLTSGGDIDLQTPGDLHSKARIQNITGTLGNVNIEANDDVRLDGERVLVNC